MTVRELIEILGEFAGHMEIYVRSPDEDGDFFIDEIVEKDNQVFITTTE